MMNLTNMRIGKRLAVGFGIALALTLTIAAVGWWGIATVNSAQDEAIAYTNNAVRARAINNDVTDIYLAIWHIATTSDRASQQEYRAALQKSREVYKNRISEARANAHSEQSKQLLTKIDEALAASREVNNRVVELVSQGKQQEAIALFSETGTKQFAAVDEQLEALCHWEEDQSKKAADAADALDLRARMILGTIVLVVVALTIVFAILITQRRRSAKSPRPLPIFQRRPTFWPSTPPSKRRVPAPPERASRWWPTRSRNWPSRPRRRRKTSRRRSPECRTRPRAQCRRSRPSPA